MGQKLLHKWSDVEKEFTERKKLLNITIASTNSVLANKVAQLENLAEPLRRAQLYAPGTDGIPELKLKYLDRTGQDSSTSKIADYSEAARAAFEIAGEQFDTFVTNKIDDECLKAITEAEELGKEIERIKARREELESKTLLKWDEEFGILKATYEKHHAFKLWGNIGHGLLSPKLISIDDRTGILRSNEPLVVCALPFYFEPDMATVLSDGAVYVTAGYESQYGSIRDWTTITLAAAAGQLESAAPEIKVIGVNSAVPVKCKAVKIKSRMYLSDFGTPFNYTEIKSEAVGAASEFFHMKPILDGFRADYVGFRGAALDLGCESVQHVFDGDRAMTTIVVESPKMRAPLGPAAMKAKESQDAASARKQLERDR